MALKKEFIKIRVTKEEKEKLKERSESEKKTLSSYILEKSLCKETGGIRLLSNEVEAWDFFNEIYHQIEKSGNRKLRESIWGIYEKYTGGCRKENAEYECTERNFAEWRRA